MFMSMFLLSHFPVPGPIGKVTVSNVTGTSFSLEWSADIRLSPAFYLMLVSPRGPAKTMETQNNNVTLSGLEPGTLYLVEIVAKVCGKEGARTQLKVRTGKDVWTHRQAWKAQQRRARLWGTGCPFP